MRLLFCRKCITFSSIHTELGQALISLVVQHTEICVSLGLTLSCLKKRKLWKQKQKKSETAVRYLFKLESWSTWCTICAFFCYRCFLFLLFTLFAVDKTSWSDQSKVPFWVEQLISFLLSRLLSWNEGNVFTKDWFLRSSVQTQETDFSVALLKTLFGFPSKGLVIVLYSFWKLNIILYSV